MFLFFQTLFTLDVRRLPIELGGPLSRLPTGWLWTLEPHKGLKWGKVLRLQRFYVSSRQRMNHPPRYLVLNTEAGGKFVQSADIISSQIGTFV